MKLGVKAEGKAKTKFWLCTLVVVVVVFLSLWASKNSSAFNPKSEVYVSQTSSNKCSSGIYKGPHLDKTYFTKDPWLWVVTPEFGNRFCMPSHFISTELKGAEAIAFRLIDKPVVETCQLKMGKTSCYGAKSFRFEIYLKSDSKLPKLHTNEYFQKRNVSSALLLNASSQEWRFLSEKANRSKELALSPHFEMTQVGLFATADEWIVGPNMVLEETTFLESAFNGLDFYAFEGSSGFFLKPEVQQNTTNRFSILFKPLANSSTKPLTNQSTTSMSYSIQMPRAFTDQMAEVDRELGFKLPKD